MRFLREVPDSHNKPLFGLQLKMELASGTLANVAHQCGQRESPTFTPDAVLFVLARGYELLEGLRRKNIVHRFAFDLLPYKIIVT
jgi:hypothetical protein